MFPKASEFFPVLLFSVESYVFWSWSLLPLTDPSFPDPSDSLAGSDVWPEFPDTRPERRFDISPFEPPRAPSADSTCSSVIPNS